eukprot:12205588-Prorocentrum_lima.AAC.1
MASNAGELGHPRGRPCRGRTVTGSSPGARNCNSRPQPPRTACAASSPPRSATSRRRGSHRAES